MSQAMGMPGEGFGTSPLDANRQFMTPDFYKKYLRKSALSQESADEATAFGQLITGSGNLDAIPPPSQGSFSMATLRGQERQNQVELAAEGLGARLETLRARGSRIVKPLPPNIIAKEILDKLYVDKKKVKNNKVLFSLETIQDMSNLQLLIALNLTLINRGGDGPGLLKGLLLEAGTLGVGEVPAPDLANKLKEIVLAMNYNEPNIEIPFRSETTGVPASKILTILKDVKESNLVALIREAQQARKDYLREIESDEIPFSDTPAPASMGGGYAGTSAAMAEPGFPGAPGGSGFVGVPSSAVQATSQPLPNFRPFSLQELSLRDKLRNLNLRMTEQSSPPLGPPVRRLLPEVQRLPRGVTLRPGPVNIRTIPDTRPAPPGTLRIKDTIPDDPLQSKTKKELKQMVASRGLRGYGSLNKDDLIKLLRK
jgi:hypothetical protein